MLSNAPFQNSIDYLESLEALDLIQSEDFQSLVELSCHLLGEFRFNEHQQIQKLGKNEWIASRYSSTTFLQQLSKASIHSIIDSTDAVKTINHLRSTLVDQQASLKNDNDDYNHHLVHALPPVLWTQQQSWLQTLSPAFLADYALLLPMLVVPPTPDNTLNLTNMVTQDKVGLSSVAKSALLNVIQQFHTDIMSGSEYLILPRPSLDINARQLIKKRLGNASSDGKVPEPHHSQRQHCCMDDFHISDDDENDHQFSCNGMPSVTVEGLNSKNGAFFSETVTIVEKSRSQELWSTTGSSGLNTANMSTTTHQPSEPSRISPYWSPPLSAKSSKGAISSQFQLTRAQKNDSLSTISSTSSVPSLLQPSSILPLSNSLFNTGHDQPSTSPETVFFLTNQGATPPNASPQHLDTNLIDKYASLGQRTSSLHEKHPCPRSQVALSAQLSYTKAFVVPTVMPIGLKHNHWGHITKESEDDSLLNSSITPLPSSPSDHVNVLSSRPPALQTEMELFYSRASPSPSSSFSPISEPTHLHLLTPFSQSMVSPSMEIAQQPSSLYDNLVRQSPTSPLSPTLPASSPLSVLASTSTSQMENNRQVDSFFSPGNNLREFLAMRHSQCATTSSSILMMNSQTFPLKNNGDDLLEKMASQTVGKRRWSEFHDIDYVELSRKKEQWRWSKPNKNRK